jgi:glyoxylase-like metal-dependent hydrolase (beta-lactamase superfamily II)
VTAPDAAVLNGPFYPFDDVPGPGELVAIRSGVYWLRMPLPGMGLTHINLWLLEDGGGWTLIDTGVHTEAVISLWETLFESGMAGRPLKRVIVTHMHPDHVGCAGFLTRRFDVQLWMSREEYLMARVLTADTGREVPSEALGFYRGAGLDDEEMARYQRRFGAFGTLVSPMPESHRRLQDRDTITIGGYDWRVLIGRGHTPEHACLHCPELQLFIAGDQLLPTISTNVSVWPTEPLANPLKDWLASCQSLSEALPEDVLVLPAHGKPFTGAGERFAALIEGHDEGLKQVYDACRTPQRAVDLFVPLFGREVSGDHVILAVGESIAHLNYLIGENQLRRSRDDSGVFWYQQFA